MQITLSFFVSDQNIFLAIIVCEKGQWHNMDNDFLVSCILEGLYFICSAVNCTKNVIPFFRHQVLDRLKLLVNVISKICSSVSKNRCLCFLLQEKIYDLIVVNKYIIQHYYFLIRSQDYVEMCIGLRV